MASKKSVLERDMKVFLPTDSVQKQGSCAYTNSYLFYSGMENWIFLFFLWQLFMYLKTDIVLASLSALSLLISSDYFAKRLDSFGCFYVLSLVCFRRNLFCTVSSCWLLQCKLIRADVSNPPRTLCWTAGLLLKSRIMFTASDVIDVILNACLPVESDSCLLDLKQGQELHLSQAVFLRKQSSQLPAPEL